MLNVLLYALLAWFLYNLVFRFILPIYRTTRQMKQKFREMHAQMQGQQETAPGYSAPGADAGAAKRPSGAPAKGDYLDFEEVK